MLVIKKVKLLDQTRSSEQVGGPVKSPVCPALASHKLKSFSFGNLRRKQTESLGPDKQGLFVLSGDHPTNSSHRNRQGNAEQGTANYTTDETGNRNTFGSVR